MKISRLIFLIVAISGSSIEYGFSQETQGGANCEIEAAADAALQQQIALIDAAKVNVPDFFSGSNSCINENLLKSFDLSSMIPDLAGFMQGGAQNIAQDLINQAKHQVCKVLNDQLEKTILKMRQAVGHVNDNVGDELAAMLGGTTSGLKVPSIKGIGQYDFNNNQQSNSNTNSYVPPQQPVQQFQLRGVPDNNFKPQETRTQQSPADTSISDFGRLINGE